jgi:hypothetical protein
MKNCEFLCNGIRLALEMALHKETDLKTGKILVRASRGYLQTYLNELQVIQGTGKESLKTGGEEFFLLDLVVNFKEEKVTFYKANLLKLLKLDKDISQFIPTLIQPESSFSNSWRGLTNAKQNAILAIQNQASIYHRKKWEKLAFAQPVLQMKKPVSTKNS